MHQNEWSGPQLAAGRTVTAKVPTKSRVEALLINRSSYHSIKVVIGLGIASTTCGIIVCLFGVVYSLVDIESSLTSAYCEASIGVWIILNGFITIISGSRPHSSGHLYVLMLSSLMTIGLTGALSIIIANSILNSNRFESSFKMNRNVIENIDLLNNPPTILINAVMLTFCVLSFILSIVSFYISSHSVCQCSYDNHFGDNFITKFNANPEVITKRDRILQWIVQQSDVQFSRNTSIRDYETISFKSKKKLSHLNSTATDSTRLSAYDK